MNIINIIFRNGDRRSSESGCDSDGSDNRAPGSNRPKTSTSSVMFPHQTLTGTTNHVDNHNSLFSTEIFSESATIDYQQKLLLAQRGRSFTIKVDYTKLLI